MKILMVGGGGREHAILWKLSQSPKSPKLYCAPGNAGISGIAQCVNIDAEDIKGILTFAEEAKIDMAVIGPEVPLAMGIVDELQKIGIRTFGPNKKCAKLEASKSFTKSFLLRHNIPTAGYREFTDKEELLANVGIYGYPMVIKADGLAAGKGVVIAENREDAIKAINEMMVEKIFGAAGDKVVVEEFLRGTEASMLCFVDGNTIVPMESAQDYKRIYDNDLGPNTGGMGAYSPSLIFTEELERQIKTSILDPTLRGFAEDGLDFKGVLFIGLMIGKEGPKVIEFNNRFGDPETQVVLPRLETDLLDIFEGVIDGRLKDVDIKWKKEKAVCVVLASGGYPGSYEKGKEIFGLDNIEKAFQTHNAQKHNQESMIFHAGTKFETIKESGRSGELEKTEKTDFNTNCVLTNGGRVLGATALGSTHEDARKKAYELVKKITFEGSQYRNDIGILNDHSI